MWPFGRTSREHPSPKRPEHSLGRRGEKLARRYLKGAGMKILADNYRCPRGEIDLVALDTSTSAAGRGTICFVEVKTRSSDKYTDPDSAVNADKQQRIRAAAEYYLTSHRAGDFNVRYDIVAIVIRDGQDPQITHIADVF